MEGGLLNRFPDKVADLSTSTCHHETRGLSVKMLTLLTLTSCNLCLYVHQDIITQL